LGDEMMKHQKFIHKSIYLVMLVLGMLAGCQQQTVFIPMVVSPTPFAVDTSEPTPIPSPALTTIPTLTSISTKYQLTFMSDCKEDASCMYTIPVGCLESKQPCLGEPQQLFGITKQSLGPVPPILSYGWSPNGLKVVIEAVGINGKGDIFIGDWDGQNWVNLTNSPTYESSPVWSPDGLSIAYIANSGEPSHFLRAFTVKLNNKEVSQLLATSDLPSVGPLYWAPDGKQVAFARSDEQGYYQLFLANPDGSNLKQLTSEEENHGLFGFSPDGRWLLFTLETEIGAAFDNLYRIRVDGSEKVAITQDTEGFKIGLVWSPIGDWIAFTSKVEGNYNIYIIRSDGTGLTRVTESSIDEFAPAWRILSP
jgi:Tol biopolymer transport system component